MITTAIALLVPATFAAPRTAELTTSISAPASQGVYQTARWTASVTNSGRKDASGTVLTISLPPTATSPQVYVMGVLGATSPGCALSGTDLVCNVGTVARGQTRSVWFDIALPWSLGPLDFATDASTPSGEGNTGDNTDSATANVTYVAHDITADVVMWNDHCTGQGLQGFYECTLFPSSLSSHEATFHADGSISFDFDPGYGGSWQVVGDALSFTYTYGPDVVAEFAGNGVDGDCWEGITTFPGSPYVSPYSVCAQ